MKGIFPGSFCPPTSGHIDIIERAAKLVDKLIVVVGVNSQKTYSISAEERKQLLIAATGHLPNVETVAYDGFMTDFCVQNGVDVIIKAVRNALDLQGIIDIERLTNQFWHGETLLLIADKQYENISSSLVREMVLSKKSIDGLVPEAIKHRVAQLLIKNVQ